MQAEKAPSLGLFLPEKSRAGVWIVGKGGHGISSIEKESVAGRKKAPL